MPGFHGRSFAHGDTRLTQYGSIQPLFLHAYGHLVYARHVLALHHTFEVHVAKRCHLHAYRVVEVPLRAQHQYVGLYAHGLQLLHRVLRWFRLQFVGSLEVGHVCKVYANGVSAQLPPQLSDSLHEGSALYVAYGAAHLGNDEVQLLVIIAVVSQHTALYLVSDVWHHLNGLAKVVALAFAVYDCFVDAPRGDAVVARCPDARKALVVP